jgi:hypothetical protein
MAKGTRLFVLGLVAAVCCCMRSDVYLATCYGNDPCNACKDCKYCAHCAKQGGTCGVCKRLRVLTARIK